MASPSNIKLTVSVDGAATQTGPTSGGIVATTGDTIQLGSTSTSGAKSYLYEILDFPSGFACPSGWSTAANGTYYSAAAVPTVWNIPASSAIWGDYVLRLTIDGGLRANGETSTAAADLIDNTVGIRVASASGFFDVARYTDSQFDQLRGWAGAIKSNIRTMEAFASASALTAPAGSGDDDKIATASSSNLVYNNHITLDARTDASVATPASGKVRVYKSSTVGEVTLKSDTGGAMGLSAYGAPFPRFYGAIAGGVTDDTAAIQAAILAQKTRKVSLDDRTSLTWRITDSLTWHNNDTGSEWYNGSVFEGPSVRLNSNIGGTGAKLIWDGAADRAALSVRATDVRIKNLQVVVASGKTLREVIATDHSTLATLGCGSCTFENVGAFGAQNGGGNITNFWKNGGRDIAQANLEYFKFEGCNMQYLTGEGFWSAATSGQAKNIMFNDCRVFGNSNVTYSAVTRSGGTSGPVATISGAGASAFRYLVEITTGGSRGTAIFKWSSDNGANYTTGATTAASVALGSTGVTIAFPTGTYVVGEIYAWYAYYNDRLDHAIRFDSGSFIANNLVAGYCDLILKLGGQGAAISGLDSEGCGQLIDESAIGSSAAYSFAIQNKIRVALNGLDQSGVWAEFGGAGPISIGPGVDFDIVTLPYSPSLGRMLKASDFKVTVNQHAIGSRVRDQGVVWPNSQPYKYTEQTHFPLTISSKGGFCQQPTSYSSETASGYFVPSNGVEFDPTEDRTPLMPFGTGLDITTAGKRYAIANTNTEIKEFFDRAGKSRVYQESTGFQGAILNTTKTGVPQALITSGKYYSVTDNADLNPGLGSWLCYGVMRFTSIGANQAIFSKGSNSTTTGFRCVINSSNKMQILWGADADAYAASAVSIATGVDYYLGWGIDAYNRHFSAITRSGGTSGPVVSVSGFPDAHYRYLVEITTGGSRGTAIFKWSSNNGGSYTSGVTTAATVTLTTGITLTMPTGTYVSGEVYAFDVHGYVCYYYPEGMTLGGAMTKERTSTRLLGVGSNASEARIGADLAGNMAAEIGLTCLRFNKGDTCVEITGKVTERFFRDMLSHCGASA